MIFIIHEYEEIMIIYMGLFIIAAEMRHWEWYFASRCFIIRKKLVSVDSYLIKVQDTVEML